MDTCDRCKKKTDDLVHFGETMEYHDAYVCHACEDAEEARRFPERATIKKLKRVAKAAAAVMPHLVIHQRLGALGVVDIIALREELVAALHDAGFDV